MGRCEGVYEEDCSYVPRREACRVLDGCLDPNKIYYYKTSKIDDECVWIYESPTSKYYIIGCHISKIRPIELDKIGRCVFRKDEECGHTESCKFCLPKLKEKFPKFEF